MDNPRYREDEMRKQAIDAATEDIVSLFILISSAEAMIEKADATGAIEYLTDAARKCAALINYLHQNDPKT